MRKGLEALAFGFVCVVLLTAAPLTGMAAQVKTGTATGRTVPCGIGPVTTKREEAALLKAEWPLSVYQGSTLVRKASFRLGSTFRFALPPGIYVISNDATPPQHPAYSGSSPFRISSGRSTHVVVEDLCTY
jgi:hypothetical protein